MPLLDAPRPGTFCWVELGTSNQEAAKTFYTSLFGWSFHDSPIGPQMTYTIFQVSGQDVAAAYTLGPEHKDAAPYWRLYVAVESADRGAARASQLGGALVAPPFDVMQKGRMAAIHDPTGTHFAIWQAGTQAGTGMGGGLGTLCWADLNTPDPDRAQRFYEHLFGWTFTRGEKGGDYFHIKHEEQFIGGMPSESHGPPHWLSYFQVADCAASVKKAEALGARINLPPMALENVGTIAALADPQGALFALYEASR